MSSVRELKYQDDDDECYYDVFGLRTTYLCLHVVSVSNIEKKASNEICGVLFCGCTYND